MDLELTADQDELHRVAVDFMDRHAPLSLARAFLDRTDAPAPLHRHIAELGWYAVGLEPDDPFGVVGLCLLAEQAGAHAAPTALIDTSVVARIVAGADAAVQERWMPRLLAGELTAALAIVEPDGSSGLVSSTLDVEHVAGLGVRLNGIKLGVVHGATVDVLAIIGSISGELACFLVELGREGLSIHPVSDLDAASAPVKVSLDDVVVEPSSTVIGCPGSIELALAVGQVAVAAEALGAAERAIDMARQYALEREQFGRVIGSFQALAHLLADLYVLCETSRSTVLYTAAALDERLPDAIQGTAVAKAYVSDAARRISEGALQVLGGIGFTWEHDFHLLHRRVLSAERRLGGVAHHERRIGEQLAQHLAVST